MLPRPEQHGANMPATRTTTTPLEPTRTAEKADSDDGSEASNWADNMKSRSTGVTGPKSQVATWGQGII